MCMLIVSLLLNARGILDGLREEQIFNKRNHRMNNIVNVNRFRCSGHFFSMHLFSFTHGFSFFMLSGLLVVQQN